MHTNGVLVSRGCCCNEVCGSPLTAIVNPTDSIRTLKFNVAARTRRPTVCIDKTMRASYIPIYVYLIIICAGGRYKSE